MVLISQQDLKDYDDIVLGMPFVQKYELRIHYLFMRGYDGKIIDVNQEITF